MIYECDYQHGTVEVYDARGSHRGEFNPITDQQIRRPCPAEPWSLDDGSDL